MTNFIAGVMLLAGTVMIVVGRDLPEITIPAASDPVRDAAVLLTMALVLAILFVFTSSADRRCADDYAFQLLTAGTFVGMMTMIVAHGLWSLDFATEWLGLTPLYEPDLMALGMIGWGVGYFTFRVRGLL